MELWTSLLLAIGLLTVVAGVAYAATRRVPVDDISPEALSEVLGKRDQHGHVTRG